MVQLTISQHSFRWWHGAKQATSHYLHQCGPSSLTHICSTRRRWVKWRISRIIRQGLIRGYYHDRNVLSAYISTRLRLRRICHWSNMNDNDCCYGLVCAYILHFHAPFLTFYHVFGVHETYLAIMGHDFYITFEDFLLTILIPVGCQAHFLTTAFLAFSHTVEDTIFNLSIKYSLLWLPGCM